MSGGLVHKYVPRGTAVTAFKCRDPELLLSGPAGTGKSRALIEKFHLMCLRNPGMRVLMLRKVLASLASTGLVTYREHVAAESIAAGDVTYYGGSAQHPAQYRYSNGSTVTIGGMDKATKIMSSEYDVIYVQEAIELTESDWEAATTRLRNGKVSFQQLMADTNPDVPTHWLHQRVIQGRTTMLNTKHEDNPRLYTDDGELTPGGRAYMTALDNLTGVRKERLRYGRWIAAEGLVYEEFDPNLHVKTFPPAMVSKDWPRYWVVDFGYTNPFVLQCWAEDPDGRLHLYRELYRAKRLVEDHARDILRIVRDEDGKWKEPRPRAIICDHDAEDRATLERYLEMSTQPAHKGVSDGIQAVQQRMRPAGDGKPRIYFSPHALVEKDMDLDLVKKPTCTLEELPGYVWDKPKEGTAAAEKPPKEAPLKMNDHGADCVRYMCAHLDLVPRPRVRWMP